MRRSSSAVRVPGSEAERGSGRIRTTLGELVAAVYDALGPDASEEEVAELVRRLGGGTSARPKVRVGWRATLPEPWSRGGGAAWSALGDAWIGCGADARSPVTVRSHVGAVGW